MLNNSPRTETKTLTAFITDDGHSVTPGTNAQLHALIWDEEIGFEAMTSFEGIQGAHAVGLNDGVFKVNAAFFRGFQVRALKAHSEKLDGKRVTHFRKGDVASVAKVVDLEAGVFEVRWASGLVTVVDMTEIEFIGLETA